MEFCWTNNNAEKSRIGESECVVQVKAMTSCKRAVVEEEAK
jgi:hypothetical protein